jgi:hypothetical protein
LRFVALLLIGFTLFMVAGIATIEARVDADFAGDSMLATVRVIAFPVHTGNRVTLLIEPVNDARLPPKARVTWLEPLSVPALGDIWQLELRLRRPRGNSIPGVFSVENWMFREQMHASGYVVPGKRNRLIEAEKRSGMAAFRQSFVQTAQTEAGAAAAVLAAGSGGHRGRHAAFVDSGALAAIRNNRHQSPDGDLGFAYRSRCERRICVDFTDCWRIEAWRQSSGLRDSGFDLASRRLRYGFGFCSASAEGDADVAAGQPGGVSAPSARVTQSGGDGGFVGFSDQPDIFDGARV